MRDDGLGAGVARRNRERVFKSFFRVSRRVDEGEVGEVGERAGARISS